MGSSSWATSSSAALLASPLPAFTICGIPMPWHLSAGDDIKTVQENLGHATAAFTLDVYGHVTEQMKLDSAARMERFIQSVATG